MAELIIGGWAIITIIAFYRYKKGLLSALLGVLFFFPIPLLGNGSHMILFIDVIPFLLSLPYMKGIIQKKRDALWYVCFFSFVVLPFMTFLFSVAVGEVESLRPYMYLIRRINLMIIFLLSLEYSFKINISIFLAAALFFWSIIIVYALLYYTGIYTDIPNYLFTGELKYEFHSSFENLGAAKGLLIYNKAGISIYSSFFIFLSIYFFQVTTKLKFRILLLFVIIGLFGCIILSGSRTGLLGCVVPLLLSMGYLSVKKGKNIAVFIIIISVMGVVLFMIMTNLSMNKFDNIDEDGSLPARLNAWSQVVNYSFTSLRIFFIGNGIKSFQDISTTGFIHPHSDFFEVIWIEGWIGGMLYISKIIFLFKIFFISTYKEFLIPLFLSGIIFASTIGYIMIYEPRLSQYGAITIFLLGVFSSRSQFYKTILFRLNKLKYF